MKDGAIFFYLEHYVGIRISKVTYGNFCHIPFDSNNPEHQLRMKNVFISASGDRRISDSFDVILPKVGLKAIRRHVTIDNSLCAFSEHTNL